MAMREGLSGFWPAVRSPLVVAGLLFFGVGMGDTIAGSSKLQQYEALLRATPVHHADDPAALFPTVNEAQERRELARAKLGFYSLLVTVGQVMMAVGSALAMIGLLRARLRPPRAAPESPLAN
jgi:hypothetical protein